MTRNHSKPVLLGPDQDLADPVKSRALPGQGQSVRELALNNPARARMDQTRSARARMDQPRPSQARLGHSSQDQGPSELSSPARAKTSPRQGQQRQTRLWSAKTSQSWSGQGRAGSKSRVRAGLRHPGPGSASRSQSQNHSLADRSHPQMLIAEFLWYY